MATSDNTPSWRVTSSVEELDTSQPGQAVPSQRITFVTDPGGVQGSVLVPDARVGDLEYVRSVIGGKAAQLTTLNTLTSG